MNKITEWTSQEKSELLTYLYSLLDDRGISAYNITMHGSFVNGIPTDDSDIDICFWVDESLIVNNHIKYNRLKPFDRSTRYLFNNKKLSLFMRSQNNYDMVTKFENGRGGYHVWDLSAYDLVNNILLEGKDDNEYYNFIHQ